MLELLKEAKKANIPAKYVLFDSWFSSPSSIHAVKGIGYDIIGMVKKTPKMFFRYNKTKTKRTFQIPLSVMVDVVKMETSFRPKLFMFVTETNEKSISASFQPILNWTKMKSSVSMEKDRISRFSLKSVKAICI